MPNPPLHDIKIVDLSLLLPGPYCTHLLQGYGAQVTAVKPPHGDLLQSLPPYVKDSNGDRCGAYFEYMHREKTLVTLNLKTKSGIEALESLLARTDILVEGFRPGVMARLGLDYETLRAHFPRLIYVSITGYGQTGPKHALPGHDLNYMASVGVLDHFIRSTGIPFIPPLPFADFIGGALAAVQKIAMALYAREKSGTGVYLDINMEAGLRDLLLELPRIRARIPGQENEPFLPFFASPRYSVYAAKDGSHLALGCVEDKFWENFCAAAGRADLLDPNRYPASANICIDDKGLRRELEALFGSKTGVEWETLMQGVDTCLTPVARY